MKRISLKYFIDKSNEVHNFKYDYSVSKYTNSRTKIEIVCPIHQSFWQTPNAHQNGRGCPKCLGNLPLSIDEMLVRFTYKHGDKYDYSKSEFNGNWNKIVIVCKSHGEFRQAPQQHFTQGCPACARVKKITTQDFIEKAKVAHDNYYDYSKSEYVGRYKKVIIICPVHGEFEQNSNAHLSGKGCVKCFASISLKETKWLDSLNVPNENRNVIFNLGGRRFNVDGYFGDYKVIYEFLGDYWHGNPSCYKEDEINVNCKKTFGQLFAETVSKIKTLRQYGFKVICIWESDFDRKNY